MRNRGIGLVICVLVSGIESSGLELEFEIGVTAFVVALVEPSQVQLSQVRLSQVQSQVQLRVSPPIKGQDLLTSLQVRKILLSHHWFLVPQQVHLVSPGAEDVLVRLLRGIGAPIDPFHPNPVCSVSFRLTC